MDGEIIYALLGIIVFGVVARKIWQSDISSPIINLEEDTRDRVLKGYKKELYEALLPLKKDKKARIAKKNELLKRFSDELHRNVFFQEIEIREIILDLADGY